MRLPTSSPEGPCSPHHPTSHSAAHATSTLTPEDELLAQFEELGVRDLHEEQLQSMLQLREIRESSEFTVERWQRNLPKFYVVSHGRYVGVFDNWETCAEQTHGFGGCIHKSFKNVDLALQRWRNTCLDGIVTNALHVDSLWPKVVSDRELERRLRIANAAPSPGRAVPVPPERYNTNRARHSVSATVSSTPTRRRRSEAAASTSTV